MSPSVSGQQKRVRYFCCLLFMCFLGFFPWVMIGFFDANYGIYCLYPCQHIGYHLIMPGLTGRIRSMSSHIVGYPRVGAKRELKFALESFWDGKSSAEELQKVAADLRVSMWKQMTDVGIKYIPSNTFSFYDQVLDTTSMLGAVPSRYSWNGGEIGFEVYFSMARGNASVPAMEMTKWFDTN